MGASPRASILTAASAPVSPPACRGSSSFVVRSWCTLPVLHAAGCKRHEITASGHSSFGIANLVCVKVSQGTNHQILQALVAKTRVHDAPKVEIYKKALPIVGCLV